MALSITTNSLTITATREVGRAYLALRELIADSEYWQAIVANPKSTISDIETVVADGLSAADRAAALAKTFVNRIDNEGALLTFPSCIIKRAKGIRSETRFGVEDFDVGGSFYVEFLLQVPDAYKDYPGLQEIDMAEKSDAILAVTKGTLGEDRMVFSTRDDIEFEQLHPNETNGDTCYTIQYLFTYISGGG